MRLIEVPFTIRPRPLLFHPFDVREEIMDTVTRGMTLALESVDIQCRIDMLSGRNISLVHITSHPWEFSEIGSWGHKGKSNAKNLVAFLNEMTALYNVEFLTTSGFSRRWEEQCCPTHSSKHKRPETPA
jgi:hypothetical protein